MLIRAGLGKVGGKSGRGKSGTGYDFWGKVEDRGKSGTGKSRKVRGKSGTGYDFSIL